jgi:hypothetical protein
LYHLIKIINKYKSGVWNFFLKKDYCLKSLQLISENGLVDSVLPFYPRVENSGCHITIEWNELDKEYWGEEENIDEAKKIAHEMDLELKSTSYVKKILGETLNVCYENLINAGVPYNIAKNALHDGHLSLLNVIIQFENSIHLKRVYVADPRENR